MQMNTVTAGALVDRDHAQTALGAVCSDAAGDNSEMKHDVLFERFSQRLKAQVGPDVYASWFGRLKLHSASKSLVRLTVPTTFLKSWINNRYLDLITSIFQQEDPAILKVEILVRSASRNMKAPAADERPVAETAPAAPARKSSAQAIGQLAGPVGNVAAARSTPNSPLFGSPLDSRYTFDGYVEGASNRVALAAAKTIAEAGAGAVRFNPLFIHSSVGLGKTHLLQAIANAAVQSPRAPRVVYLTAEYFMWRFATAIRDNDALTLKDSLRHIDLLIIDDMQFLQGKMIQHEFCHLLNMLLDSAKQVVVAADRAPWELESLDPRVRSRLQGGVAIEMEAPDYEMRLEMLKSRLDAAKKDDASLDIPLEILSDLPPLFRAELVGRAGRRTARPSGRGLRTEARAHRGHPAHRRPALQRLAPGTGVEPPDPRHRQAAPDRHVSRQDAYAALLPGNRPPFRRARSHHRAARGAQDRGTGRRGHQAQPRDRASQAADQRKQRVTKGRRRRRPLSLWGIRYP